ncbi:ureidoglycolate dehydrogenase [Virgibacillus ihumii]|uniref:ureidoglycolate dehydrogenase n=1 Tax=Virgibacillus ihumii TaxID=2686091 RepID=UPI00157D0435|nr:ureidoglycolate dehydrogenase [Virgibacillus ihumii]
MSDTILEPMKLKTLVMDKLTEASVLKEHAEIVADVLVHADLRGVSSHGALRTEHYVKRLNKGGVNPTPKIEIKERGKSAALVDGDNGFGHVIMKEAMDKAIQLTKENGIGMVAVTNSSHCGALSYFAEQAAKKEVVSMVMTQTDSAVVPFGGAEPYFGTNPVAYGFPARKHKPIILDMATSNVALGKILHAKESGESIPDSWGVDSNGQPVTDPKLVKYLLPVGGPKGYGLALTVDVLSGILTGSEFGTSISSMYGDYKNYRRLGHVILTINPGLFISKDDFLKNIDLMIDEIHKVQPAEGHNLVMVPGEPEQIKEEELMKKGVPVTESVYNYLTS